MNLQEHVLELVKLERVRQNTIHGKKNELIQPLDHKPLTLLMEELGEAAQTLDNLENTDDEHLRQQLIQHYISEWVQVTALGVQALERLLAIELHSRTNS